MSRYRFTRSAKRELDQIWLDVAQLSGSIEVAERVLWLLHRKIVSLALSPGIGRSCDDVDRDGRCSPVGNYLIYYRATKSGISITHIFHGARDQGLAWGGPD